MNFSNDLDADFVPSDLSLPLDLGSTYPQRPVGRKLRTDIPGWGVDADLANRPGYPQLVSPPHPIGNGSLGVPAQQTSGEPSVQGAQRPRTAVYGTAVAPSGLSGAIRKLAYEIPDYKAQRWMLLIFADKVDVLEHNVGRSLVTVGVVTAGILGLRALGVFGGRKRKASLWSWAGR